MRILHITPYYAPAYPFGGVVSAVQGLTGALARHGHDVQVLTTDALDYERPHARLAETLDGIAVRRCRNRFYALRTRLNLSTPRGWGDTLRELFATGLFDVLHLHELRTVENLATLRFLRTLPPESRPPVVLSPHGTISYGAGRAAVKRGWDALWGRVLLRCFDGIAALTATESAEARELWTKQGVPFPACAVIPNGVESGLAERVERADRAAFRGEYLPGEGPLVLFLGRLHERKGLQYLVPAFARVAHEFPDARLLIAGPDAGMALAMRLLADTLGIGERVVFVGMLEGAARDGALASADLFVLPAVGEGLSMACLEALVAGLPVILTPGCNLPEVADQGAGLVVEREVEALAGALRELLGAPEKRAAMRARAIAWARAAFTWETVAAQTEQFYAALRAPADG